MPGAISTPAIQAAVLCLSLFLSVGMVAYSYGDRCKVIFQQALEGGIYSSTKLRQQAKVAARRGRRRAGTQYVRPLNDIAEETYLRPTQKVVQ